MRKLWLGIDTSNYTTSICLVDEQGQIDREARMLLNVSEGERGLQQSAAVFQHVHNLPMLFEQVGALSAQLSGVSVSDKPRPIDGSYMPVFTCGVAVARSIAALAGIPLVFVSHQEGHLAAAEGMIGEIETNPFLAIHLSGGTTDVLFVRRQSYGYEIETLGSSLDLHAGQFVDRVGVALGLPFPAGEHLEKMARDAHVNDQVSLPVTVDDCNMSFSGPESAAQRLIRRGASKASVASAVERAIAKAVEKAVLNAASRYSFRDVLLVGGVAANGTLRTRLEHRLSHQAVGLSLYFAPPRYSTDNAFGVARLGWKSARHEHPLSPGAALF